MKNPAPANIGQLIRQRRSELGRDVNGRHRPLSASKFGRLIGLEGASVYSLERGDSSPSYQTLVALVQRAGMDPVTLLGEQGAVDLAAAGVAS